MTIGFVPSTNRRRRQGHEFEANVFGIEPQPFDPKTIHRFGERPGFQACLAEVLKMQETLPFNPRRPTGSIRWLFEAVKDNLPRGTREQLLVYCALGSTLDNEFGTDGFFVLESRPWHPVTFDLATYEKKNRKADLLITKNDMRRKERIARIVAAIIERLITQNGRGARKKIHRKKRKMHRARFWN